MVRSQREKFVTPRFPRPPSRSRQHARPYKGLLDHLGEVLECDDIGKGGLNLGAA